MTGLIQPLQSLWQNWRDDVDAAAANLPGIGGLFAQQWRILKGEPGAVRYIDAAGEECLVSDSEEAATASERLKSLSKTGPLVIRFSSSMGMRREANFPAAARHHLNEAVRLALPRLSPLPAEDVRFATHPDIRDVGENRLAVDISIIRNAVLVTALNRAAELGLKPSAVDLEDDDDRAGPEIDLREGNSTPSAGRSAFRWGLVAAGLLAAITLVFLADSGLRLNPQLAALQRPASLEARLEAAINQADAKARAGSATTAISDLSRRLPDGAFVTGLDYEAGELRISGLAWDAAAALSALDSAAEFTNVTFDGATVRDEETGRERFEIIARHNPSAGGDS